MSANVETMFSVRETPWHGLGRIVMDAPASREALELAGLDWQVESRNIYSGTGAMIPGYRANVRSTDDAVLGVVSDRYRIVQNEEAFQFTDDLLGEGVTYETAGSLQGGKKVWMLAKLPEKYIIAGDEVTPYLVFFNSHDGSSGVKVAMTPVRVVCQNTLNLALGNAKRIWTARHTENVLLRVQDARETLQLANSYMGELGKGMNDVSNRAVREFSEFLNSIEADFPKPTCTTAYEITMKSTIVSALITLDTEKQMDERFWNHLRVQRNILDFLYALWLDDDRTLVDEFSTIIKDLVEYDFSIAEEQMKERLNIA